MREADPKVAIADGDYLTEKDHARKSGRPHTITIKTIERRHGLKPGQLTQFRANHYSRPAWYLTHPNRKAT
jgi:hypothetical protein